MSSNKNFKETGIPSYVSKKTIYEQDIGSLTTMISASSSSHSIVITDIVASKASSGNVLLYDGDNVCIRVGFSSNGDTIWSHAFSTPLKLTKGNSFKIKSNTSDIDLCVTVCYYEVYDR
tara:strand:+ start:27267 stop:27623 length:357 start_codon:yes stop_codon:yes gene_type:complete